MRKLLTMALVIVAGAAQADVLVRTDESSIKGTFKGGTDSAVVFDVGGNIQQINYADILSIMFSARAGSAQVSLAAGGTGTGAAIGGAVAVLSAGGNHVGIPKGSKAQVALTADVKL